MLIEKIKKHGSKLRLQFILIQIAVIVPTLVILQIILYNQTCSLLIKTNSESYSKILESTDVVLNTNLKYYRDISRRILADEVLQEELTRSEKIITTDNFLNSISFIKINQALKNDIYGNYGLTSLYIFDNNWKMYYGGTNDFSPMNNYEVETLQKLPYINKAFENEGYEVFAGYDIITGDERYFSCIKELKNLETQEKIGLMIIIFDKSVLNSILLEDSNGIYSVIDKGAEKDRIFLFGQTKNITEQEFMELYQEQNGQYYFNEYDDVSGDMCLVFCIAKKDIVKDAEKIRIIILNISFVLAILLILATICIWNNITKPLYLLRDDIIKVGKGERTLERTYPDNEIGEIGDEFKRMVHDKLALSEKIAQTELRNKEAELELLQSNINPHFLYNTLDLLYWMAIVHETDDIAELTQALSDIFKTALSKGEMFITFEKELEFVQNYLYIQNIRFDGKIKSEIQISHELKKRKIAKLLLQPFVENAVYHGLEPQKEDGFIHMKIYEEDKFIHILIQDNGVGMDSTDEIYKGYAIRNTMERIHLIYGENSGVSFRSEKGKGTTVEIIIEAGIENDESSIDR